MFKSVPGALAVVALLLVGACRDEDHTLELSAVLTESGTDVSTRVDWFVERDGAWLGPETGPVLDAVPGLYTARLDVLGSDPAIGEVELVENSGGALRLDLDASLVEVTLAPADQMANIAFDFRSDHSIGNQGVRPSDDGVVRVLVSRDLSELLLLIGERRIPVQADFSAGSALRFVQSGDTLEVTEE